MRDESGPTAAHGAVAVSPVYLADPPEHRAVVNPYLGGDRRGWWEGVDNEALVDDAVPYVELEGRARSVRTFQIDLVDGLLQTPDYAAALVRAGQPGIGEDVVGQRVLARRARQARLGGGDPLAVEAIVTEGALRIRVGGPGVMRAQLAHLDEVSRLPNVDFRVVPAATAYPAMGTPFYVLSFDGGYPDVGYVELLDKGIYLEEPDEVSSYTARFDRLRECALDRDGSRALLADIAAGLA